MTLDRMSAMLSRLGGRGYGVKEEPAVYRSAGIDFDPDSDFDLDDNESQQESPLYSCEYGCIAIAHRVLLCTSDLPFSLVRLFERNTRCHAQSSLQNLSKCVDIARDYANLRPVFHLKRWGTEAAKRGRL
jgi:hypothetical protein